MRPSLPSALVACALLAGAVAACTELPDDGNPVALELRPEEASTSATLVFHSQLHPPDPCVDFSPDRLFGHVQLKLTDFVDGSWTTSWDGMVRVGDGPFPSAGELLDEDGEVVGDFFVVPSRNLSGVVDIGGSGLLGDGSAQELVAAPEEYVVQMLDGAGDVVLDGNLGLHPPDPC